MCLLVFCFMPSRIHPLVLIAACALCAGCSSTSVRTESRKESSAPVDPAATSADYSSSAVKSRTDSHAHYLAALLHEQNDEPELAANELYKAAAADPFNEPLVLEATSKLLRVRSGDKPDEKTLAARERAIELLKKATSAPNASG